MYRAFTFSVTIIFLQFQLIVKGRTAWNKMGNVFYFVLQLKKKRMNLLPETWQNINFPPLRVLIPV